MEKLSNNPLPRQAVILCGGLGTRLRPITDSIPKPMVSVNGKPFLHHLIDQIREQGICRVLLLTGYRGEMIEDYFGAGKRLNVAISYSRGLAEWDTGRRLWEARTQIDPLFLLLYSDNFVQFNMERLAELHSRLSKPISLLLAPKEAGNVRVSANGAIEDYDESRHRQGFHYVEVGYMFIERDEVLSKFPSCSGFPNFNLSFLLEKFAHEEKLAGLVVRDPYHSISDLKRLTLMIEYLKPKRILLMDRDGTINKKAPRGEYITNWQNFEWVSETLKAMRVLSDDGFKFIVITNQAGIARKKMTLEDVQTIHENMIKQLLAYGVTVLEVYMSPHHWDKNSFTRKPAPGLFFKAAKEYNLRMDRCLYVGDDERDCVAAANAGCGMVYLSDAGEDRVLEEFPKPYFMAKALTDCIGLIRKTYRAWEQAARDS